MLLVGVLTAVAAPSAGASRAAPAPLVVQSSTLDQSGQEVVWSVELRTPFSPGALGPAGCSLCLLIENVRDENATGQLCLIGPRTGRRSPRVEFRRIIGVRPGRARLGRPVIVDAAITRHGARQLSVSFPPPAIGYSYRPVRWQVRSTLAPPHCATLKGTPCVTFFPATPIVAALHPPQLVGCTDAGPAFVTSGPPTGREIALTFDDGPWYQTPQFLTLLEHDDVPATFFEIGEHISEYGEGGAIERRMLADGDMIGDHTWSHIDVAAAGALAQTQIEHAADAIRTAAHGFEPCLFRAPDGDVSPALIAEARSLGFTTIQWNIDPRDWARPGVAEIEGDVLDNARPGGIVEMHDGGGDRSETLAALPDIITTLRARGYRFVTVTQLLGQRLIYR
jgi:peptidoglycan/xylan/chitin deacetylase (PgdA/CDA1 family)